MFIVEKSTVSETLLETKKYVYTGCFTHLDCFEMQSFWFKVVFDSKLQDIFCGIHLTYLVVRYGTIGCA